MFRRNGKPRSCEPCRISKVKCDHATPICTKCETRGITEQCFYHPNPMTKPAGTPRKKPEPRRRKGDAATAKARSLQVPGRLSSLTFSPPTLRSDVNPACVGNAWPTPPASDNQAAPHTNGNTDSARSFYLGSTSYASVFSEKQPLPDSLYAQPSERISVAPSLSAKSIGTRHCQFSVARSIVARLSPFSFYEKILKIYFETQKASAVVGPLILTALPQLRKDLELLAACGNDSNSVYVEMIKNTSRPLDVPSTMLPSQFHTLFTGENLRWETLGLILIIAASAAQFTSPLDPIFTLEDGSTVHRDDFLEDTIQATNDCIHLCQVHGAVNDIMVWLIYTNMLVISNFYGDNYHGTWRRMGESISALYAAGIHCESEFPVGNHGEPLFLRETRRRVYAAHYRSDKTLAVFFGRPPMMSWRYSDRRQPLDLSDAVIGSDDPSIVQEALAKLDDRGWSTEPAFHPPSYIRIRSQMGVIKERLLEEFLAGEKDTKIIENLEKISAELKKFWENVPMHLRYDTYSEEGAWNELGPSITVRLISAYLEYLHMHFQIARLKHRQSQQELPALLEVSLRLLSTSLVSTKPSNRVYETRRHFPTVILFYCFPAAGVLALELRRCTLEGICLPSTVSRADVIRKLSVLTSCLEWIVLPGDGNHKLCSELNKMLALILDEVLNYEQCEDELPNVQDSLADNETTVYDAPLIGGLEVVPTEPEDFLNWLDNVTWSNTDLF